MNLTVFAVLIIVSCIIAFFLFASYFLAHADILFGFKNETKETEATVVSFVIRGLGTPDNPTSVTPVIEYYNVFAGQTVRKEMFNSGLKAPKDYESDNPTMGNIKHGDCVKVQYTNKKVRVIDERFVSPDKFKLSRYIIPLIVCAALAFSGFVLLVFSIVWSYEL